MTDIKQLPNDLSELIHIVDSGEMPNIAGVLKYDFRKTDYLYLGITFGIIGVAILSYAIWAGSADKSSQTVLNILFVVFIVSAFFHGFVYYFKLFKESVKGRTYVLLTNKYLLIREGRNVGYFLWCKIYDLKLVGTRGVYWSTSWDKIAFTYNGVHLNLSFPHLSEKSRIFLAEQLNKYWQAFKSTYFSDDTQFERQGR